MTEEIHIHADLKPIMISSNIWEIPIGFVDNMKKPAIIYGSNQIMKQLNKELDEWVANKTNLYPALVQIAFGSTIENAISPYIGFPNSNPSVGFSNGGVIGLESTISLKGLGNDVNCGIRIMATHLSIEDILPFKKKLINIISQYVPSGFVKKKKGLVNKKKFHEILKKGAIWAIENGMGVPDDLEYCEDNGNMPLDEVSFISEKAIDNGIKHLGTIGSGKYFIEIDVVDEIFNPKIANILGLKKNEVVVLIHSGARGFGYQVVDDIIKSFPKSNPNIKPNQSQDEIINDIFQLIPINSEIGHTFVKSIQAISNYSLCNRQIITHYVRTAFKEVLNIKKLSIDLIYDLSYNTIRAEKIGDKEVFVYRKGVTCSFGPNHFKLPQKYVDVGQPSIICGPIGTISVIGVGTNENKALNSLCYNCGQNKNTEIELTPDDVLKDLNQKGIEIIVTNKNTLTDEAEQNNNKMSDILEICMENKLFNKVVKVIPVGIIKR